MVSLEPGLNSKKWLRRKSPNPLVEYFEATFSQEDFAGNLALDNFDRILSECPEDEELLLRCLEECIYSAVLATINENLLLNINKYPQKVVEIVNHYELHTPSREKLIAAQTGAHMDYILAGGHCAGCDHCKFHQDVNDLMPPWESGDTHFFTNLYVGMSAINFAFDQIIYDLMPTSPDFLDQVNNEVIFEFRQYVFKIAEQLYQELMNE